MTQHQIEPSRESLEAAKKLDKKLEDEALTQEGIIRIIAVALEESWLQGIRDAEMYRRLQQMGLMKG